VNKEQVSTPEPDVIPTPKARTVKRQMTPTADSVVAPPLDDRLLTSEASDTDSQIADTDKESCHEESQIQPVLTVHKIIIIEPSIRQQTGKLHKGL